MQALDRRSQFSKTLWHLFVKDKQEKALTPQTGTLKRERAESPEAEIQAVRRRRLYKKCIESGMLAIANSPATYNDDKDDEVYETLGDVLNSEFADEQPVRARGAAGDRRGAGASTASVKPKNNDGDTAAGKSLGSSKSAKFPSSLPSLKMTVGGEPITSTTIFFQNIKTSFIFLNTPWTLYHYIHIFFEIELLLKCWVHSG